MDLTTPIATGALLALFTAIQTWINRGRFDTVDRRFDALQGRMDAHEQSNERRFEQLSAEIAQLSDLLQVVLALTPRQQTG